MTTSEGGRDNGRSSALLQVRTRLGILRRVLVREANVLSVEPEALAQHLRNALFLDHGDSGDAGWLLARAELALRKRPWLRLTNRPWVPVSRTAYLYSLPVAPVTWTPDGRYLVHGSDLLDPTTGQLRGTLKDGPRPTAGMPAWSPDGEMLAAAGEDGNLVLRDVGLGTVETTATDHEQIMVLAWSPDGRRLASGGTDGRVLLWDLESRRRSEGRSPAAPTVRPAGCKFRSRRPITSLAWSPDAARLACGTWESEADVELELTFGHVVVINLSDASSETLIGHWYRVETVSWSPDGRFIASGAADETARVWSRGACLGVLLGNRGQVTHASWSPDGSLLATSGGETSFWQASAVEARSSGEQEEDAWVGRPYSHRDGVRSLAWSADGRAFASGGRNAELYIWDGTDGRLLGDATGGFGVVHDRWLAWHPRRPLLAAVLGQLFGPPRVLVWEADRARTVASVTLPDDAAGAGSLCWTCDGRFVAMPLNDGGWLWEPGASEVTFTHAEKLVGAVEGSPRRSLEVVAEGNVAAVRRSGIELARARCLSRVKATQLDPEGRVLRVADDGGTTGNRPIPYVFELCNPDCPPARGRQPARDGVPGLRSAARYGPFDSSHP